MQLTMRVNDRNTVRGAVRSKGMLSANISVFVPAHDEKFSGKAIIRAFEPPVVSEWEAGELSIGDKIEIHLVPDGDSDPATTTTQASDAPGLLFSDPNQARQALTAAHVCNEHLQGILRASRDAEPHDEALKVQMAVARLVRDLSGFLIRPTLLSHPELMPKAKELGLLD
jgi:hypothetical protein